MKRIHEKFNKAISTLSTIEYIRLATRYLDEEEIRKLKDENRDLGRSSTIENERNIFKKDEKIKINIDTY